MEMIVVLLLISKQRRRCRRTPNKKQNSNGEKPSFVQTRLSIPGRKAFLISGAAQTMQEFMWLVDMRSVVFYVRVSLFVLLDALVATAAHANSDPTSNQP